MDKISKLDKMAVANYLEKLNKWRRGDAHIRQMPDPMDLGKYLDRAVCLLREDKMKH